MIFYRCCSYTTNFLSNNFVIQLKTSLENISRDSGARLLSLQARMGVQGFKKKILADRENGVISEQRYISIRMITRRKSILRDLPVLQKKPFVRKPMNIKRDLDETFVDDDCNDDPICKVEQEKAENITNSFVKI